MADSRIIIEENYEENRDIYQPEASLFLMDEFIQIRFTKKTADAVNIYKRQSADEPWEFIATAVNSPYDDHDSEEDWQYCLMGVRENKEIGIPAVLTAFTKNSHSP